MVCARNPVHLAEHIANVCQIGNHGNGAIKVYCEVAAFADLQQALRREWLETNGQGGFAGSTIVGLNTHRYHGLLVAATKQA